MFGGNQNGGFGGNQGGGSSFGGGLGQFLSGMFGDSGKPYEDAQDAYSKYFNQATGAQQPYSQAGQNALGPYQDMIKNMSDPSAFMNKLMGQYQESPWAKYSQQQGMRAANNVGSASGMLGSTPLQMQAQQNAQNISSGDMQNWLGNALGVNQQAMGGYQDLVHGGQGAANALSGLYGQGAGDMAGFGYNKSAGEQQDRGNMFGGLANMFFPGMGGGGQGGGMDMGSIMQMLMMGGA